MASRVTRRFSQTLADSYAKFTELYPTTGEIYYANGGVPQVGELVRNPDFGAMLRSLCSAEEKAKGRGRIAGIEAARDEYYKGGVAEKIVEFINDNPVRGRQRCRSQGSADPGGHGRMETRSSRNPSP